MGASLNLLAPWQSRQGVGPPLKSMAGLYSVSPLRSAHMLETSADVAFDYPLHRTPYTVQVSYNSTMSLATFCTLQLLKQ